MQAFGTSLESHILISYILETPWRVFVSRGAASCSCSLLQLQTFIPPTFADDGLLYFQFFSESKVLPRNRRGFLFFRVTLCFRLFRLFNFHWVDTFLPSLLLNMHYGTLGCVFCAMTKQSRCTLYEPVYRPNFFVIHILYEPVYRPALLVLPAPVMSPAKFSLMQNMHKFQAVPRLETHPCHVMYYLVPFIKSAQFVCC